MTRHRFPNICSLPHLPETLYHVVRFGGTENKPVSPLCGRFESGWKRSEQSNLVT